MFRLERAADAVARAAAAVAEQERQQWDAARQAAFAALSPTAPLREWLPWLEVSGDLGTQALAAVPILRPEWLAGAALDISGSDLEVAAIHQGYLRTARRAGAQLVLGAAEVTVSRVGSVWRVECRAGVFEAPVLVNATGALRFTTQSFPNPEPDQRGDLD